MAAAGWFPPFSPLPDARGTRFRIVCAEADRMLLHLYDPDETLVLGPEHRTGDVWAIHAPGVGAGRRYNWAREEGRPLVDPYALAVDGPARFGSDDPERPRPPLADVNRDATFKGVVVAPPQGERAPRPATPWPDSVVYELHVRGYTRHESAGADAPGTYRALAERAGELRDLGVTAIELLPVHEFDETEVRRGRGLFNFWGYSPFAWLAPNRRYAASDDPVTEFRALTDAFHRAGIQVIVDVVFNHTGELDADGPTFNLRALGEKMYYLHEERTGELANLTGCGNTVNAQHPVVRALIRDALRWWVHGLGVDGFRFDLASILARDEQGRLLEAPPLVREIETDPWLTGVHLVAEAWDAAGGYLVGRWPGGDRWAVWNDRFRDDVRRAWLHPGLQPHVLADRLRGSADLFPAGPARSVNYVTAHDGFPLADAVSYERKHNEANGEDNRDGHNGEVSANHGHEGPTDEPAIRAARDLARRNLVASVLVARGVPMLLAGDELGRTQRGNNNAYCHDSELAWIDWRGRERDAAFHGFVRRLLRLRAETPSLRAGEDAGWFGPAGEPDWEHGRFGYRVRAAEGPDAAVLVNLGDRDAEFLLPDGAWDLAIDTARPDDSGGPRRGAYTVAARSLAVLRYPGVSAGSPGSVPESSSSPSP